jgi:hypothetical protein
MDSRPRLIDRNGRSESPRSGHCSRRHRRKFLIATKGLELLATQTKHCATPKPNRKRMPVCPTSYERGRVSKPPKKREVSSEVTTEVYNRLRKFELLLRLDWLPRNRPARAAAPATASATSTATAGTAAATRSTAAAAPATAASAMTSARAARVAAPALATTAPARRSRRYGIRRRVHAIRIRLAEGIHHRDYDEDNHCHQKRVFGSVLSRFLSPEPFEEFQHNSAFNSRGLAVRVLRTAFNLYSPISRELQPGASCIPIGPAPVSSVLRGFVFAGVMGGLCVVNAALMRIFFLVMEPLRRSARGSGFRHYGRTKRKAHKQRRQNSRELHLCPPSRSPIKKLECPRNIGALKLPVRPGQSCVLVLRSPLAARFIASGGNMVSELHV